MIQCPKCTHYLLKATAACPFCADAGRGRRRSGLLAASLASMLTGCPSDPPTPDPSEDATVSDAAAQDARASTDSGQDAVVRDAATLDAMVDMVPEPNPEPEPIGCPPYGIPPLDPEPMPEPEPGEDMALPDMAAPDMRLPDTDPEPVPPYGIPPEPNPE